MNHANPRPFSFPRIVRDHAALIALASSLLFFGRAHAQDAAEPAAERAKDDQDEPQAPPTLLSVPLPAQKSAIESPATIAPTASSEEQGTGAENDSSSIPGDPWGDAQGPSVISLRALMQLRYGSTFAATSRNPLISGREKEELLAEDGDGWQMSRLLVRLASEPSQYVGFRTVLDFADLARGNFESTLKQAFTVLRPVPERLEFTAGLFKLPFSTLELDPSSRYEFVNFGPGNRLVSDLGFAGRDLGVQVMVAPFKKPKRLRLSFGAFRGHAHDEHDSPAGSLAARAESKPTKWLRLGADWVEHLKALTYNRPFNTSGKDVLPDPPDPQYPAQRNWGKGRAFSVDARIKKKGFNLRGEFMMGDRVDLDARYGAESFWCAWGLLSYRIEVGPVTLYPAARAEWLDADREHRGGLWRTFSSSLTLLFLERVRVLVDVTRTDVAKTTPLLDQPKPLQIPPYLALDTTRVTAQLQLEL